MADEGVLCFKNLSLATSALVTGFSAAMILVPSVMVKVYCRGASTPLLEDVLRLTGSTGLLAAGLLCSVSNSKDEKVRKTAAYSVGVAALLHGGLELALLLPQKRDSYVMAPVVASAVLDLILAGLWFCQGCTACGGSCKDKK